MGNLPSLLTFALLLIAPAAEATIGDRPPANPCPAAAPYKRKFAVLDVSGDGSYMGVAGCPNNVLAETAIVCTVKDVVPADMAIEYFDASGAGIGGPLAVGTNAFCTLPPGSTLTFYTTPSVMPKPWGGVGAVPGAVPVSSGAGSACPVGQGVPGCFRHGSARVLSTTKFLQCTATRLDMKLPCGSSTALTPDAVKPLTIIKVPSQQGD